MNFALFLHLRTMDCFGYGLPVPSFFCSVPPWRRRWALPPHIGIDTLLASFWFSWLLSFFRVPMTATQDGTIRPCPQTLVSYDCRTFRPRPRPCPVLQQVPWLSATALALLSLSLSGPSAGCLVTSNCNGTLDHVPRSRFPVIATQMAPSTMLLDPDLRAITQPWLALSVLFGSKLNGTLYIPALVLVFGPSPAGWVPVAAVLEFVSLSALIPRSSS